MMTQTGRPSFSIVSIAAVICAVLSFMASGGIGLLLAILAIIGGAIGVCLAFMPSVRGGLISLVAALGGVIGIGVAIAKLVVG